MSKVLRIKSKRPVAVRKGKPAYNPFLATLCLAVQDARRAGVSKRSERDSLNKFLKQLVGDGTIDIVMASELFDQAKELNAIEFETIARDSQRLPDPATYNLFLIRAKNYAVNVLGPGGMRADLGQTITAKLKKCFLCMTRTNDLKEITESQWEAIFAQLDTAAKASSRNAVAFVSNILTTKL